MAGASSAQATTTRETKRKGLSFSPGSHAYRLDGRPVPSVIGILGVLEKPAIRGGRPGRSLSMWLIGPVRSTSCARWDVTAWSPRSPNVPWGERDRAATRGTDVH